MVEIIRTNSNQIFWHFLRESTFFIPYINNFFKYRCTIHLFVACFLPLITILIYNITLISNTYKHGIHTSIIYLFKYSGYIIIFIVILLCWCSVCVGYYIFGHATIDLIYTGGFLTFIDVLVQCSGIDVHLIYYWQLYTSQSISYDERSQNH